MNPRRRRLISVSRDIPTVPPGCRSLPRGNLSPLLSPKLYPPPPPLPPLPFPARWVPSRLRRRVRGRTANIIKNISAPSNIYKQPVCVTGTESGKPCYFAFIATAGNGLAYPTSIRRLVVLYRADYIRYPVDDLGLLLYLSSRRKKTTNCRVGGG